MNKLIALKNRLIAMGFNATLYISPHPEVEDSEVQIGEVGITIYGKKYEVSKLLPTGNIRFSGLINTYPELIVKINEYL